jgi:hypothetical protein
MGKALHANNAVSTLASGITNVATSLTVATGQGALFPSPTGGDYFWLTLDDGVNVEIVKVTARSGDVFTIVRGQQGGGGVAFSTGATAAHRWTRDDSNGVGGSGNVTISAADQLSIANEALLTAIGTPSTPGAGVMAFYARKKGRILPAFVGPSGLDSTIQAAIHGNNVVLCTPSGTSTTVLQLGATFTVAATGSNPALASTNFLSQMKRHVSTTSAVSGNAAGLRSGSTVCWRGNVAGQGGFFFRARIGVVTFQAAMEIFVGLSGLTGLLGGAPSAQNNTVALTKDTGDTNWFLLFRDGTTSNRIDLGLAVAANQVLDVCFFSAPNGSTIDVYIERLDSPSVLIDNVSYNTNLPVNTTFLTAHSECRTNAGSAVALACNKIYIETDN